MKEPAIKKTLFMMLAGLLFGVCIQAFTSDAASFPIQTRQGESSIVIESVETKDIEERGLRAGLAIAEVSYISNGTEQKLDTPEQISTFLRQPATGTVAWILAEGQEAPVSVTSRLREDAIRAQIVAPIALLARLFMRLLKMLIIPLVLFSIIMGVVNLGDTSQLKRLGASTFVYYSLTSLMAILTGLFVVNMIRPGTGAELGLPPIQKTAFLGGDSFVDVLERAIPTNAIAAFSNNGAMLQVIVFAVLLGVAILILPDRSRKKAEDFFEMMNDVVAALAMLVLRLLPYGVFVLMAKTVAETGVALLRPMLLYMLSVLAALLIHACFSLGGVLMWVAKRSPMTWFSQMSEALLTAFSTSSSSMTLPMTMKCVTQKASVDDSVASFTLPLGATVNMDGTALYECVGVIFLAQYYAGVSGFDLGFSQQMTVVILALLASIGAAGIPSAGLVMMVTILSALGLPLEGAAILLAVDRPLDMCRTTVNVWSDTCAAAVMHRFYQKKTD